MFVFIVPLRSPETCSDWEKISLLCNETLHSITQQDSTEYRVILVCNSPPLNFVQNDRIKLVQETFAIPKSWDEANGDIYAKVKRGMLEIKKLQLVKANSSVFVMRVDADDLVSNRLVSFTENFNESDGWYFPTGYIYQIGSDRIFIRPRFDMVSGTSHIIRCDYSDFPESMETPATDWLDVIWQHLQVNKLLEERKRKLTPLPFPGAVYRINSQNLSSTNLEDKRFSSLKSILWKAFSKRKLSSKIIEEFGFPTLE
ncbi:glycosyltransferase family A protein [Chamaesiphon sp. OTE_8_metabat_110]|uniref:glycosyltransferase family A protein n=1 Tax=Chamaesiphon sp. OTE_8_metabat_110 TaxID=2964696 RepID=UPI00286D4B9F|nr:glycosyltransferase family A protein [Chamaesiphon sp. OTE_8_metabat_110]